MKLLAIMVFFALTIAYCLTSGCDQMDHRRRVLEEYERAKARELSKELPNSAMRYTEIGKNLIRKYPEETKYCGDAPTTGPR